MSKRGQFPIKLRGGLPVAKMLPPPLPPRRGGPPPLPGAAPPPLPGDRPTDLPGSLAENPFQSDRERYGADIGAPVGRWVGVVSTNVNRIKFDPNYDMEGQLTGDGTITVEFLSLAVYEYSDCPNAMWVDFVNSSSKGMFVYYRLRDWPSQRRVRDGSRPVTRTMKRARDPHHGRIPAEIRHLNTS